MSHISINTDISSDIFEDVYKYPEWFNKKKYIFYNKTLERLQRLSHLHTRSSQYYDRMHYYIFGPSIAITALSGIASFLSTSQFIDSNTQNVFGVGVGIVASLSSVLQSIAGACQFSAKKEAHRTVAEEYNKLIVNLKFEIEMPNEKEFTDNLEQQIIDIQNKCNYFIPQSIIDSYDNKKNKKISTSISNTIKPIRHKNISKKNDINKNDVTDMTHTNKNNVTKKNNRNENDENVVINITDNENDNLLSKNETEI